MPGNIRVSVLESVDLPAEATGGKYVSIKVGIGKREFQTKLSQSDGDKRAVWNSDFSFPVLNLRDNLMVALLDSKGNTISRTEIVTPVIVEKGSLDELFTLKGGGCVHLKLSFVLTLEERMRIETMREAALQKKEHRTVKKSVMVLKPIEENRTNASDLGTDITLTLPEKGKSNDDSHNEKNQATTIVVPQLSLPNVMKEKTDSIKGASLAPILPPIEQVSRKEASSYDLKDISDHDVKDYRRQYLLQHDLEEALSNEIQKKTASMKEASLDRSMLPVEHVTYKEASSHDLRDTSDHVLEDNGHKNLPVHDLEEAASTISSKKIFPPKDSSLNSFSMSSHDSQNEEVMQANSQFANENQIPSQLTTVKYNLAKSENLDNHNSTDKFSMIGPEKTEFEKKDIVSILAYPLVVSEIPSSKKFPPTKDSSFNSSNMSSSQAQSEKITQAIVPFANQNLMPVLVPPVKNGIAEPENSGTQNSVNKFNMIGPGHFEKKDTTSILADPMVVSEIPSSQDLLTIHGAEENHVPGSLLHQENRTLAIYSLGSCPLPDCSDSQGSANSATHFVTVVGTSDMPPSESGCLLRFDGTANVIFAKPSNGKDITTSSLSTSLNVLPLQSSRNDSISPTPWLDIPSEATGEESIPFPNFLPESSEPDEMFKLHQPVDSTKSPTASTAYGATIPDKEIIPSGHSDSAFCTENLSMDQTSSSMANVENPELFAKEISPVQNSTINSRDIVSPSDTGNGSFAGLVTEGLCEASSLQIVPSQSSPVANSLRGSISSNIANRIGKQVQTVVSTYSPNPLASMTMPGDGRQSGVKANIMTGDGRHSGVKAKIMQGAGRQSVVKAKVKAFEKTLSSQTMKRDDRQSGVKAKIRAFESSLSQDPDYHSSTTLKCDNKIEAERAWQRLRAEAAAAEAAEAQRRAEEEEAKLKSITEGKERKLGLQQKPEESRLTTPAKLRTNKQDDKRQTQEDANHITVAEEVIQMNEAYRGKEGVIQKAPGKSPEIGERNRKQQEEKEDKKQTEEDANDNTVAEEVTRTDEAYIRMEGVIQKPPEKRPEIDERNRKQEEEKEDNRQIQENAKHIKVAKEVRQTNEAYRGKQGVIQKAPEKRPQIGERNRKQEEEKGDKKHMQENIKHFTISKEVIRTNETYRGKEGTIQKAPEKVPEIGEVNRKLEEDKEDKRQMQENVKCITVAEEGIRTDEAYRGKEGVIPKADEKRPEIDERNRKDEGMAALRNHLKEQEEGLLRTIETKEKKAEADLRQKALNWERMRLANLQLKRNLQDETLKSDLSARKNEVVEKSKMNESKKALWSTKASEQKQKVGVQVGESQLCKDEARKSGAEASQITTEKEKQRKDNNNNLFIDQRVHLMTLGNSSDENIDAKEDATISEENLKDLVNGSAAFAAFIKQALGAAALLTAGALFMWLRGETMIRRRSRMTQSNNQHYFLPNGEAASRILQGDNDKPNSRIPNVNSKDLLYP